MSIINTLKDQSAFGFTGKINILMKSNDQFLGVIFQEGGLIVDARYKNLEGCDALIQLIYHDVLSLHEFKLVIEPEIIENKNRVMEMSVETIKSIVENLYPRFEQASKLAPSKKYSLLLNSEIVVNQEDFSFDEFNLLCQISDYPSINDLYEKSQFLEYELTELLVQLRKKKAIKIFQNP